MTGTYEALRRMMEPLERRLRAMAMRATVTLVDDSTDLQEIQVERLEGEVLDGCERVGQYGLASNPPVGTQAVVIQIGSNADHQVVIGVDDASRPHPLESGQTVVYDDAGTQVRLLGNGQLVLVASAAVTLVAPTVAVSGNLIVTGNVTINGTLNGHAP